jgi:hypothetical protein
MGYRPGRAAHLIQNVKTAVQGIANPAGQAQGIARQGKIQVVARPPTRYTG